MKSFRVCLTLFQRYRLVPNRLCLRLLGLIVSAILVIRLGRLYMREFQCWVASLRPPCWTGSVSWPCVIGELLGTVSSRKVVTNDTSLIGWGGIHKGRTGEAIGARLSSSSTYPSSSSCHLFSPVPVGSSCPSQDRQHDNAGIYKPPRRFTLPDAALPGKQTDPVDPVRVSSL